MGNDGLVISESQPITEVGKFTWLQILTDGTRKWYERSNGGWVMVKQEEPAITVDAEGNVTPTALQIHNLNITGNLFCKGDNGANAEVTAGGLHMVVKEGIVTTLEEV